MNIITWNVNGLRAVERKDELAAFLAEQGPQVLMLQETKGSKEQFEALLERYTDYRQFYSSAEQKGYAGTALWVLHDCLKEFDQVEFHQHIPQAPNADEGRICHLAFEYRAQACDLLSIYFPNGGKSDQAWQEKLIFYARVHDYINTLRQRQRLVVVGGDLNVAHTEIDIARPKENAGKIGFHPKERAWMQGVVDDAWIDVWRHRNPGVTDVYSWWHARSRSRARNVGWRIDYFLLAANQAERVEEVEYLTAQQGSDHCPLRMVLRF